MPAISWSKLSALFIVAFGAGLLVSGLLVRSGSAFPALPGTLALTLLVIGIAVFLASLPISHYRKSAERGEFAKRPNPFFAIRILLFARATSITATGFSGWFLGQLGWLFLFGNPVEALVTTTALALLAGGAMLVLGYLAELNCRAPKEPESEVGK